MDDDDDPPTVVTIDVAGGQFTASNFRENSSASSTSTVSWVASTEGYRFQVVDSDDWSLEGTSFESSSGAGPFGYLAAFAGLDRSDIRSDPTLAAATSVVPFSYQNRDGVVVAWWSDVDDIDGQVFTCIP